jgi:hypothetical protein
MHQYKQQSSNTTHIKPYTARKYTQLPCSFLQLLAANFSSRTYTMDPITRKLYTILHLHHGNLKDDTVETTASTYSARYFNHSTPFNPLTNKLQTTSPS